MPGISLLDDMPPRICNIIRALAREVRVLPSSWEVYGVSRVKIFVAITFAPLLLLFLPKIAKGDMLTWLFIIY